MFLFLPFNFQTFIYLFAPICTNVREADFLQSFRLESGKKIWQAMWEFRHPDAECFTSPVSIYLILQLLPSFPTCPFSLVMVQKTVRILSSFQLPSYKKLSLNMHIQKSLCHIEVEGCSFNPISNLEY